ncbi:hypothetical protein C5167_046660 [Papaver somniferum]|uniref:Uncharacterized protein n=1 Tax=Papaver somniferum TaxID=3469 RepID=A0A4Y7LIC1_PAPSO|nr:hypothetical protein C5167_046660 [Papaver somniferum]
MLSSFRRSVFQTRRFNGDSVLDLLENYGFTKPYISKLITWYPKILKSNVQKTLKPKFDFFKSKGLSGTDLAEFFLSCSPIVLKTSLQGQIIPCCDTLKNIVQFDKNVFVIIRCHSWLLTGNIYLQNLMVNIELLRDEGIPQSNFSNFLTNQPSSLTISTTKFEEIVHQIKGMGFDPSQTKFLNGLVKNQISLSWLMQMGNESFLEKFEIKFVVDAPELLKLYPSAVLQWLRNDARQFRGLVLRFSSSQIHWQQKLSVSGLELSGQSKKVIVK